MKTQPKRSKRKAVHVLGFGAWVVCLVFTGRINAADEKLPGTKAWDIKAEAATEMVAGIDRYLTRALEAAPKTRAADWKADTASLEAYLKWLEPKRDRLREIIGAIDERVPFHDIDMVASTAAPPIVGEGKDYKMIMVRWPVLEGVYAEGLMLEPQEHAPYASVVAIPDADWTPEQLVGLAEGVPPQAQFARRLVESGCRVIVPKIIDRADTLSGHERVRFTNQPHREFLYRPAYQMGRHIIGYEVQKVLAVIDWFTSEGRGNDPLIGVIGYGEGGLLAMYSAALDPRIDAVVVSGYFQPREQLWREPIYRNVWSLLREFGDAELLTMIAPRTAIIEASKHPEIKGPPPERPDRSGAAPGMIQTPKPEAVRAEFERARDLLGKVELSGRLELVEDEKGPGQPGSVQALTSLMHALGGKPLEDDAGIPNASGAVHDLAERNNRQFNQLNEYTQRVVRSSPVRRREFWKKADNSSLEKWVETTKFYRDYLWDEIFGRLPKPEVPANPRSRLVYDEAKWKGYEVVLDLYPDVIASGILLVPKGIKDGERRPVVVCQHGLEGTSRDTITRDGQAFAYYQAFAARLAERGFIVFSPQNPYIGKDNFRVLQRKANPIKLSLFGFIVRQHERILQWLAEQPFVDAKRIGFYGLSYGGKTAVRVPAVLDQYALSICSGDWNDWITKTTSNEDLYSYLFHGEYEMFEFGLGDTFNYGELVGLIAPRPFMVERGHGDTVAPDEWVGYEYAKVRRLYDTLGISDRSTIEWFNGPHQIHGVGTFEFLHQHLKWPEPASDKAAASK